MAGIKGWLKRETFLSFPFTFQSDSGLQACESRRSTFTCVCSDVCDSKKKHTNVCKNWIPHSNPNPEKFDTSSQ